MGPLQTIVGVETFGARIGVRAPASIGAGLSLRLPPRSNNITNTTFDTTYTIQNTLVESASESSAFDVDRDGESLGTAMGLDAVRFELESDMHFRVALAARGFLFVHAGVVEHEGRAIVIPGRTLAGKSSLVMALVRAGATYYSDEYAVVDGHGMVHPYRKPLSERVENRDVPHLHSPESLGAAGDAPALPISRIVITRYRPEARWDPASVSRGEALMALFDNTVVARERPGFALELLAKAVAEATAIRSDRSEAEDAAASLLNEGRPPRE